MMGMVAYGYSTPYAHKSLLEEPMPTGHYNRTHKNRDIIVPIGPSIAYVPLSSGYWALIDSHNSARVGQFNWYAKINKKETRRINVYAARKIRGVKGTPVEFLHRFIAPPTIGTVDHINPHATLDDRECNLREADVFQQAHNTRPHIDNLSGHKNITKRNNFWRVNIMSRGIKTYIGKLSSLEEAISIRDRIIVDINGEFSRKS